MSDSSKPQGYGPGAYQDTYQGEAVKKEHKKKPKGQAKVKKSMEEFSEGKLHSGSKKGPVVTDKAQALAIGYSEQKKENKRHRAKKKK